MAEQSDHAIDLGMIDVGRVNGELARRGLDKSGSIHVRTARLQGALLRESELPGKVSARCDRCGGVSEASLPACPLCGEDGVVDVDRFDPEDPNDVRAIEAAPEQLPPGALPEEMVPPWSEDGAALSAGPALLDKAAERVKRAGSIAALQLHDIGTVLGWVQRSGLWRVRLDSAGNIRYRTFWDWARDELSISRSWASKLIDVAIEFSRADVDQYGVTRLAIGLRVPERVRAQYLAQAGQLPARSREIRNLANQLAGREDPAESAEGAPHAPETSGTAKDPRRVEMPQSGAHLPLKVFAKITTKLDRIPLWRRNPSEVHPLKRESRARSITENPWAVLELNQTQILILRVKRDHDGHLELFAELREPNRQLRAVLDNV